MRATDSGLVDIIDPVAPSVADWHAIALALTALAVLALLVTILRRSARMRARWQLTRLRRRVRAGQVSPRTAAFEIVALLRSGLRLRPSQTSHARAADPPRWHRFMERLTTLRYAPTPPSVEHALAAIGEARYWLRPWT